MQAAAGDEHVSSKARGFEQILACKCMNMPCMCQTCALTPRPLISSGCMAGQAYAAEYTPRVFAEVKIDRTPGLLRTDTYTPSRPGYGVTQGGGPYLCMSMVLGGSSSREAVPAAAQTSTSSSRKVSKCCWSKRLMVPMHQQHPSLSSHLPRPCPLRCCGLLRLAATHTASQLSVSAAGWSQSDIQSDIHLGFAAAHSTAAKVQLHWWLVTGGGGMCCFVQLGDTAAAWAVPPKQQ